MHELHLQQLQGPSGYSGSTIAIPTGGRYEYSGRCTGGRYVYSGRWLSGGAGQSQSVAGAGNAIPTGGKSEGQSGF